jgi:hypothetical protein
MLAVLSAGLLALGVPRTANSIMRLFAGSEEDLSKFSGLQDPATVLVNSMRLESVDDWFHDPDASIRAGTLQFLLGMSGTTPDRDNIKRAITNLEIGLARQPGNTKAWTLLALARFQDEDIDGAKLALRTSILVAPYDPTQLLARTELGLKLVPVLDGDEWRLVSEQIRMAADHQMAGLIKLAKSSPDTTPILTALADDPERAAAVVSALSSPAK